MGNETLMAAAPAPIFVDQSGRRRLHVRRVGRVIRVCVLVYFLLVAAGFAKLSSVPRLSLPRVGSILPPTPPRGSAALGPNALFTPASATGAPTQLVDPGAPLPSVAGVPAGPNGVLGGQSLPDGGRIDVPPGGATPSLGETSPGIAPVNGPADQVAATPPPAAGTNPSTGAAPPGLASGPGASAPPAMGQPGTSRGAARPDVSSKSPGR
jgi:hypothetical protein